MSTHLQSTDNGSYIVTFYSHFGAVRFKKLCDARGILAKVMPVPRNLSSSCGTCVRCGQLICNTETFDINRFVPDAACLDEIEQVVQVQESGYESLYRAENS